MFMKQSIEPFMPTLVWGFLLAETTRLVFCSVNVRSQKLWTFWQWHSWHVTLAKRDPCKVTKQMFRRDPCSAPSTRTAISLALVTTILAKMHLIILVFGTQELQLFGRMTEVPTVSIVKGLWVPKCKSCAPNEICSWALWKMPSRFAMQTIETLKVSMPTQNGWKQWPFQIAFGFL